MAGQKRTRLGSSALQRGLAVSAVFAALLFCVTAVRVLEDRMSVKIENAGMQMTAHTNTRSTAQVFMNEKWYAERNIDALLVMGVDDYGSLMTTDTYNNAHQADFLVLFLRDIDTGRTAAIHLNRDIMTDIMIFGVTGEPVGTRRAQLALAYNYGEGDAGSSSNVVSAVEHLLYGIDIDHYITITMDAVPILNDWVEGVPIEILDDFTDIDHALIRGELVRLNGQQALAYVRTRRGLDDSTNLHRMERQRQYASEWVKSAQDKLKDAQAVSDLVLRLNDHYRSNATIEQLAIYAESLSNNPSMTVYEIDGNAVQGEVYMEYHVNEAELQQLVLKLFYAPVE